MVRTAIDPISRIEGHLRVEMEVENGVVTDAWVSGGCFRGIERTVENRTPDDAVHIVQRICGVCPVSHGHSASIAGERALGITISNNARLIRNLVEGAQFLHSHILWLYNLTAFDYVNPLEGLKAKPADAWDLAQSLGTSTNTDFRNVQSRLQSFIENRQLSIFSGNWFDAEDGTGYRLEPEANLLLTSHYFEALRMQARASEIAGLLGGKMPHIASAAVGGSTFIPTVQKLDDLKALILELKEWIDATVIQDTLLLTQAYKDAFSYGKGCGRYIAWGVFEGDGWPYEGEYSKQMAARYLPSGIIDEGFVLTDPDESKISEYVGRSWYKGSQTLQSPYFVTEPEFTEYNVDDRYTWVKAPSYNGRSMEAGSMSRMFAGYLRGVPNIKNGVNTLLAATGLSLNQIPSTLGRTAIRQVETVYIANLMKQWCDELIEAVTDGDSDYFRTSNTISGEGSAFWEAPRGALYHSEKIINGKIAGYQIIIPSTWNLAPRGPEDIPGPLEQALIGVPVEDIQMPINALRTVHSFDPCTACAVHVSEPASGRVFKTFSSPLGGLR